jgi:hypothetical protein
VLYGAFAVLSSRALLIDVFGPDPAASKTFFRSRFCVFQEDNDGALEMDWLGENGRVRVLAHLATLGAHFSPMLRAPADARVQLDAIDTADLRAILPAVLAYADMFKKGAFMRWLFTAPAARAFSSPKTRRTEAAPRRPPRLPLAQILKLFSTFLKKANEVRAPSSQNHQPWLTRRQLPGL